MQATIGDRRVGYDSRGYGIPLLLMHAFPLSREMYAEQNDALDKLARVLTFDAPGVGNSEPGEISIDGMALIRQSRLSVMPVTEDEFHVVLDLAK